KYQSFQEAPDDDPHILSKIQAEITGFFSMCNFIGFQNKGQGELIGTKCVVKIPIILRVFVVISSFKIRAQDHIKRKAANPIKWIDRLYM
ncbi:MAG TPA: hypothetical protein VLM43_07855, partial [Desulfobacterales bacterium]|nr:hypothetical protein [Desulfobacterales bacterium]